MESPFSEAAVEEARQAWGEVLLEKGAYEVIAEPPPGQPYLLSQAGAHLRLAGDPDHRYFVAGQNNLGEWGY